MARFYTANDIVNRAAAEVGLTPAQDPFASQDPSFKQLFVLLDSAGQEMVELHAWQHMLKEHTITTSVADDGYYTLPSDFGYMIPQTGWDRTNDVQLFGPLSSQDWQYLLGRDLVTSTIYASFRLVEGKFAIFPQPPPDGLDIHFEYMSRNWVTSQQSEENDKILKGDDIVLFEPILAIKLLKMKFLQAKGFDSTSASDEFRYMFDARTGHDETAPVLSAGNNRNYFPYLNGIRNIPDSGYGL